MTYYKLSFNNCVGVDYAFTVVPFNEIEGQINMAALDDKSEGQPAIMITHLDWTDEKYTEWFKKHVHP